MDDRAMNVFDRIVVGVDGTDFGYEALHQTLALAPTGASVHAVTALNTAQLVHAGFNMEYFMTQFEEEAERARARATEIMGDRPNCTAKVVRGDAKAVLRHAGDENEATLVALGGRSSSRFLGRWPGRPLRRCCTTRHVLCSSLAHSGVDAGIPNGWWSGWTAPRIRSQH